MAIITDIPAAYGDLRFGKGGSPNLDPELARQRLFHSIHGVGVNRGNVITDIPPEIFNAQLPDEFKARLAKIMEESGGRPAKKAV